jgi:hypothetical protein
MTTQRNLSTIAPLMTVTLLTSMGAIAPGESRAFEPLVEPAISGESRQQYAAPTSVGSVAEARWGQPNAYVVGTGGRIVPERMLSEVVGAGLIRPAHSDNPSAATPDHFDSVLQPDIQGEQKCGPSSATPAEITRLVAEAAQRHKVDVDFAIAVVTAESRLDRLRNSPKGARGPMQLMPETAERFGVTAICDPKENIEAGVRYLRELADEFRNPLLVAAAYNAGEGRVREYGGIPPFKETLGYVAEVVNIQMKLEGSSLVARGPADAAIEPRQPSNVSGVITSGERRQWVGGVMHF